MTMPALYTLAAEYIAAAERMADLELPAEVIRDTLEGLAGDLEVKAQNVAAFARNLESVADSIKAAERQMADRRKALENRAAGIREYLKEQMQHTGIRKIESPWFTLSVQDNPPAVVIADETSVPAEFMRIPDPPPATPDKIAIAAILKSGGEVPGAFLTRSQRLVIK